MRKKKCPECNGCMSPMWILPNRYYYCDFCRTYYAGPNEALILIDNPYLAKHLEEQNGQKES